MKKPYKIVSGASTPNSRELADWLAKDGQLLIPLVELLEKGERAIDEVIDVMGLLEGRYADCEKITLVCDHLNTHTKGAFYQVFEPARARELVRRIEFCHTPKHGSWLNIAENELSSMTRQCVRGRRIGDLGTLHDEVSAWSTDVNGTQRGVD